MNAPRDIDQHYHATPWAHYLFTEAEFVALKAALPPSTPDGFSSIVGPSPFSGLPVYVDECPCAAVVVPEGDQT